MKTRIELGPYVIKADSGGGWVVGKSRQRVEKGREKPIEVIDDPSYYGRLDQALSGLLQKRLHESEATSLKDLRQLIEDFKAQCADLVDFL
jgi:hypothetical protein